MSIERWWDAGERLRVRLGQTDRSVFVRRMGSGPTLTLLHGFPSSSHDWAKAAPALAEQHELVLPDFLGFGASDKPKDHTYSLHEQADLVEAVWAHAHVTTTAVLAHDYAVSVTQELLARRAAGRLTVDITSVHLCNGGLWPDLHRAEPTQLALLDPEQGPQLSAVLTEELLTGALRNTFADGYDHGQDCADIWQATARDDGHRIAHLLIRYILDRREHEQRWVEALQTTDVPLAFTWGVQDPISGGHVVPRIRERLPHARLNVLEDVGHWPPLEAPDRLVADVLSAGRATSG
jgi:pimeloyl-ACP methyl ester carboxylesterase